MRNLKSGVEFYRFERIKRLFSCILYIIILLLIYIKLHKVR